MTIHPFHDVVFLAVAMERASDSPLDVPCDTYEQAEAAGLAMLAKGRWRSFRIEKRYEAHLERTRPETCKHGSTSPDSCLDCSGLALEESLAVAKAEQAKRHTKESGTP